MLRRELKRFDHARRQPRFRKCLAAAQRQRDRAAREIGKTVRHKDFARHGFDRAQKIKILDAARPQHHQKRGQVLCCALLARGVGQRVCGSHARLDFT